MQTDALVRHARVLWRADRLIADLRLQRLLAKAGLMLLAGAIAMFALVMLGISAYLALADRMGAPLAAALVGLGALLLSGTVAFAASRLSPGRDEAVALDLHAAAVDALSAEMRAVEREAAGVVRALRHPLDGALAGLLVPLVGIIAKSFGQKAGKTES